VGQGGIGGQARIVGDVHHIHTIGEKGFFNAVQLVTDRHSFKLAGKLGGQRAAFGQQLQADVSDEAVFNFAVYKYVVHSYPMVWLLMSS